MHGLIMKIPETLLLLVSIIFEKNAAEETTLLLKESWRDHNARFLLLILSSFIYKVNYDYQLMKIQFNKKRSLHWGLKGTPGYDYGNHFYAHQSNQELDK